MRFLLLLFMLLPPLAYAGEIPNPKLTPGASTSMTVEQICSTKWGTDVRHVTEAMKRQVFARYNYSGNDDKACIPDKHGRRCEIDHARGRETGGADVIDNLWPQPYGGKWNAVMKDRLENRLHKELCAGNIKLEEARSAQLPDWRIAYRLYFGNPK